MGLPLRRGKTKMKSKSILVLLDALNMYVCLPAADGTIKL